MLRFLVCALIFFQYAFGYSVNNLCEKKHDRSCFLLQNCKKHICTDPYVNGRLDDWEGEDDDDDGDDLAPPF